MGAARSPSRRWRNRAVAGAAGAFIFLAVMAFATRYAAGYVLPNGVGFGVFAGQAVIAELSRNDAGWVLEVTPVFGFLPIWEPDAPYIPMVGLPLWVPAVAGIVFSGYAFRRSVLAGRGERGACRRCSYSLHGLPADAACPECGTRQSDTAVPGRRR